MCLFYYFQSRKFEFWFRFGPGDLLASSFPRERLVIFVIFGIFLLGNYFQLKPFAGYIKESVPDKQKLKQAFICFAFAALMLLGYVLLLLKFKLGESLNQQGFEVSNRYFVSLSPLSIMATTLFSYYLVKIPKNKIIKGVFVLFLAAVTDFRKISTR